MIVYAINNGSSSVRLAAWTVAGAERRLLAQQHHETSEPASHLQPFALAAGAPPDLVAHRFVHGGPALRGTCRIDDEVEAKLEAARPLAPLHLPPALAWMRAARAAWPAATQVAVFDTSFFRELPEAAATYPLPIELAHRAGIRRYGFHGLAHQAMWRGLIAARPELAGRRAITFQLGSGCSAAAIDAGRPLDTSMGFTPLEGLMMSTRAGDLDPGALLRLLTVGRLSVADLERVLDRESGLRGMAGDGDMRRLLARSDAAARLAIEVYCQRARKVLGSYLAVLRGAEAVVFGGGVGESAWPIRARICDGFEWCGLQLDAEANARIPSAPRSIARAGSRIDVWVVPVDEQSILLDETLTLLENRP